ncbi:chorismate mutase [Rhodoligotrophos ferricapiens]|uniref:chorismate mutase n=1 Tax=Rhodoligotrophos ferricapiens TaxID=3069264 RepID=UPI00315DF24E
MTTMLQDGQATVSTASDAQALEAVRREIDRIDEEILSLLTERFIAVEEVRRVKGLAASGLPPLRPSREAEVIRRLLALRRDPLPPEVLVSIWRELMGSATQRQQKMTVHIPAPTFGDLAFYDLVRGYFGAQTPIAGHLTTEAAIAAVMESRSDLAVVPARHKGWVEPLLRAADAPAVVARIPVIGAPAGIEAFLVGYVPTVPTGLDETLVAVTAREDAEPWANPGLLREFWRERVTESQGGSLWLGVLDGWLDEHQASAALKGETKSVIAVKVLGRYATPVR